MSTSSGEAIASPDVPHPDEDFGPPPPPRPRASTAALILAVLAIGYTMHLAQDLLLPVLLAMFFALVGNPIIRVLERLYLPRSVAALLVLVVGLAGALMLGKQLVEPAGEWLREAPRELRRLAPTVREMTRPMQEASDAAEDIARAAGGKTETAQKVEVVTPNQASPYAALLTTPIIIVSVLAVAILTFFFMVYGHRIQRSAIAMLPSRQQKKVTVEILQSIEKEVSRYVLTISAINALLGTAFAACLYFFLGMPLPDVLLWGTMIALLNFAPYVGPLIGFLVMLAVGFVEHEETWQALAPAGIYLALQATEGNFVTPIVLGSRLSLSPLILILTLAVFGWMWGILGLLLAVPLLVSFKIVMSRIEGGEGWAKVLE